MGRVAAATLSASALWQGQLRPEFEIDRASPSASRQHGHDASGGEQLHAVGATLFSWSPYIGPLASSTCSASSKHHADVCSIAGAADAAIQLRIWNMLSGERAAYVLPIGQPWVQDATVVLRQLCSLLHPRAAEAPEHFPSLEEGSLTS